MSNTTTCKDCGKEIEFGQHPFCPHGYMAGREPRQFQPIVVHRRLMEDGQYAYSYPGHADEPVSAGYEKIELSTLPQADRFVNDRNAEEQELRRMQISGEEAYWNDRAKDRRAQAKIELEKRLGKSSSRVGELVQRAIDARRAKRYNDLRNRQVDFHNQAISFDRSNRPDHWDGSSRKISVVVNGFKK